MADSHYISKFLLRNWEHPVCRTLNYFDFVSGEIRTCHAKSMYVSETPFPDDVESWLDRTIETPLGDFVSRCKRAAASPDDWKAPEANERERKALTLAVFMQPLRTGFAPDGADPDSALVTTIRRGEDFIDQLVAQMDDESTGYVVTAPGEQLYFPSLGIVALPLVGGIGFFLPLAPWLLTLRIPKTVFDGSLQDALRVPGMAAALSAGIRGDLVVLPPLRDDCDRRLVAQLVREARASAERLCKIFLQVNQRLSTDLTEARRPKKGP